MPNLISTYSGKVIDINKPKPEDICIEDIAHALSLLCRFNGHCDKFYSVAQHSVMVMHQVPDTIKLEALMHDAAEAYIGDLISPIKDVIEKDKESRDIFESLDSGFSNAINEKFNLKYIQNTNIAIHKADTIALATERRDVCTFPDKVPWPCLENVKPLRNKIQDSSHAMAKYTFMEYFKFLMEKRI